MGLVCDMQFIGLLSHSTSPQLRGIAKLFLHYPEIPLVFHGELYVGELIHCCPATLGGECGVCGREKTSGGVRVGRFLRGAL